MSSPDVSRQFIGLIEVTESIIKAYDPLKDLRDLPEAFREVNRQLPLVKQTLRSATIMANKIQSSDDAKELGTLLHTCDEKANKLLEIFMRIAKNASQGYDHLMYREIVIKQGRHRVENLMDGILQGLGNLVVHHISPVEVQAQVKLLGNAREELAKVSPSLADSELVELPGTASQHGDYSRQYNLFGEGTQKIVDGHFFEAHGNQNFGMIPARGS